jgi:hypothetical protein
VAFHYPVRRQPKGYTNVAKVEVVLGLLAQGNRRLPATGKHVEARGASIVEFANGKIPSGSYASAPASDSRFQLKRWRSTGVPRGAQVARTDGSNDTPDSSSNTISAFWRLAVLL